MGMKVTILGSGTCVPSLERSSSSFALEISGKLLLFDLGPGTMRRLLEAGYSISQVSHIFFSHLHPDHTGEFVSFLFATKYPEAYRRRIPFKVVGARGLRNFYEGLRSVYGSWIELEVLMEIIELDTNVKDQFAENAFTIDTLPMLHIESSIGYRVTAPEGSSLAYTGDTDLCENAVSLARDADLLVCEAALPDAMKVEGHLTPSLAGRIAARGRARKLLLTHFYPECETVDIEAECRKTYDGPLIIARDLMVIDV
ncbi:MAG TPA: MBL fold metallo-hydrolase [Syntrophales bacterium]|nr:MBL fold metallo-hydrolase [Syntrophales bacterium]